LDTDDEKLKERKNSGCGQRGHGVQVIAQSSAHGVLCWEE